MAAPSIVGIWNRALQLLGAQFVQDVDDRTKNALACNACYQVIRDRLLEGFVFRFSIKLATLAADSPAPTFGRANSFTLPTDFLMFAPPYPEDNFADIDYEVQDGKIYTDDTAPLQFRYVAQVEDPVRMTPLFRELLSTEMAYAMCEQLTQSNTKKAELKEEIKRVAGQARRANGRLTRPVEPPEDPYLTARR